MYLSDFIAPFLKYLKSYTKSNHTVRAYRADLEQLAKFFSKRELKDIGTSELKFYIRYLLGEEGYKPKTVSRKLNSMSTFYRFLVKKGIVKEDLTKDIKHPEIRKSLPNILTKMEYNSLRSVLKDNIKLYTIMELMLQSGLRIGEVLRLKVSDVKLDAHVPMLTIREFNSNPMRIVELTPIIVKVLKKYLAYRARVRLLNSSYLFFTKTGKPMNPRNVRTMFEFAFIEAGIENASPKDLRATFISYQLRNGVSAEKIAEVAGYKQIDSVHNFNIMPKFKKSNSHTILPVE